MTVPPEINHQITYKFTRLLDFSKTLAELPVNGLTFSKCLNAAGPWSGTIDVEDQKVKEAGWLEATSVNRSALWIDIDDKLMYGGSTTARRYQMSTGKVSLSGSDFCGYTSQRLQAKDYGNYTDPEGHNWKLSGAPVPRIAYYVLAQALEKAYSIPVKVVTVGPTPAKQYWITFSAPLAQRQSLSSIVSQLQEMGYLTGIDYACDVAYASGIPTATITLSYPRRGVESEAGPLVIDVTAATDLEYDEDGTQQADFIVEQAGATQVRSSVGIWEPAREAGYPLLELSTSHTALAPSGNPAAALEAYVAGDLTSLAYPLTAPVLTLPLFGEPSIFDINVGDNIVLRVPEVAGDQPPTNPRFPNGLEFILRIVRIDVNVQDEGLSMMALTLNLPPTTTPVEPPETINEGSGSKETSEREKPLEEKELKEEIKEGEKEAEETEKEAETSEKEATTPKAKEEAEARKKEAEERKKELEKAKKLKEALKKKEAIERTKQKAKEERERNELLHKEKEEKEHKEEKEKGEEKALKEIKEAREKSEKAEKEAKEALEKLAEKEDRLVAPEALSTNPLINKEYEPSKAHDALVTLTISHEAAHAPKLEWFIFVGGKQIAGYDAEAIGEGVVAGFVSPFTFPVPAGLSYEVRSAESIKILLAVYTLFA